MARRVAQALSNISKTLRKDTKKLASIKLEDVTKYRFYKVKQEFLETDYKIYYLNNLQDAISKNPEFSIAEYSMPLFALINDPKLLQFNFETKTISLNMKKYGGTLDNWAKAIKMARSEASGASPLKSSYYWQMIYKAAREKWEYKGTSKAKKFKTLKPGQLKKYHTYTSDRGRRRYVDQSKAKNRTKALTQLYWEIIRARVGYVGEGKAPWWYILNYGIFSGTTLPSRGGTAYPRSKVTRFVEKTELQLSKLLKAALKKVETNEKESKTTKGKPVRVKVIGRAIGRALHGEMTWEESFLEPEYGKTKVVYRSRSGQFVSREYAQTFPGSTISQKVRVSNQYTDEE